MKLFVVCLILILSVGCCGKNDEATTTKKVTDITPKEKYFLIVTYMDNEVDTLQMERGSLYCGNYERVFYYTAPEQPCDYNYIPTRNVRHIEVQSWTDEPKFKDFESRASY